MKFLSVLAHKFIDQFSKKDLENFNHNLTNLESTQIAILTKISKDLKKIHPTLNKEITYKEFRKLPITHYEQWEPYIQNQIRTGKATICDQLKHFQPTSGSSSKVKMIPYNRPFIKQLDTAYNIWIQDLYRRYPSIKEGKHYWSMSWIPNDMRDQLKTNDANLFHPFKQILLNNIFAVPDDVSKAHTIDESMYLTAKYLIEAQDLSLISVWSPTFLLSLLELIILKKEDLIFSLKNENQKILLKEINSIDELYQLWPKLGLISAWDTASSQTYAKKMIDLFPQVPFQGKGLWATEGVVTIPLDGQFLLSYTSHFYEFELVKSGAIVPSWKLKKGDEVSPIITTPNGFIRYKINDHLLVKGFRGECPILNFIGRRDGTDLVGEKLSHEQASQIIQLFNGFNLVGIMSPKVEKLPYYAFICDNTKKPDAIDIDNELRKSYHYNLARDLGQLGCVKIIRHNKPIELYQNICRQKNMISGNIKIEAVMTINSDELLYE